MDPRVLAHVVSAIGPASAAFGEAARQRVAGAHAEPLERLAVALGAAQHTAAPRGARRVIAVVVGDHGVGDPGIALGAAHPTVVAAHAIADGSAALAELARRSGAPIVLVDAGAREPGAMPASAVKLAGAASRDLLAGPAMTVVDAALGLEAGIALAVALADGGLDVLGLGALGLGAEVSSAALLGAALGAAPTGLADPLAEEAGAHGARLARSGASALERLAALGGPETAVLAGAILAAASMNIPVVLDSYATGAAALAACAFAPEVRGYLIAAQAGTFTQPAILSVLGARPVFAVGLGQGEGTGAAMVLPLIDQVTALAHRGPGPTGPAGLGG